MHICRPVDTLGKLLGYELGSKEACHVHEGFREVRGEGLVLVGKDHWSTNVAMTAMLKCLQCIAGCGGTHSIIPITL